MLLAQDVARRAAWLGAPIGIGGVPWAGERFGRGRTRRDSGSPAADISCPRGVGAARAGVRRGI